MVENVIHFQSEPPQEDESIQVEQGRRQEIVDAVEDAILAPMHAFDSPAPGTGKSMITDTISILITGERAAVVAHNGNQEEFDKHLSALLMRGGLLIAIDNCEGPLKGILLNQTLTQSVTECRILGKSESVPVRSNATISANGNNLVIEGDTTRRSICGRMDAKVERPELLTFPYAPLEDATTNRAELVIDALTILRAYHLAGRPERKELGSYNEWSGLIRGALLWLGRADPVETMEELRKNDPKLAALKTVIYQWWAIWAYGLQQPVQTPFSVSTMLRKASERKQEDDGTLGDYRYPELRDALLDVAGRGGQIDNRVLGRWLFSMKDRVVVLEFDGKRFLVKITKGTMLHGRQQWVMVMKEEEVQRVLEPVLI
jgi:putative DNA primase/helicase